MILKEKLRLLYISYFDYFFQKKSFCDCQIAWFEY